MYVCVCVSVQKVSTMFSHSIALINTGSMWSQNWQLYRNLILPFNDFHLDETIKMLNWTSIDMVEKADDFYRSLNLPPMTQKFWKNSIFEKNTNFRNCHGTAANMFEPNDYRLFSGYIFIKTVST